MDNALQIAVVSSVISGVVVILSKILDALFARSQQRRERFRWAEQLKQAQVTEVLKARMEEYPKFVPFMMNLERRDLRQCPPSEIRELASVINSWAYGRGGLCAESETCAAIQVLRKTLEQLAESQESPERIRRWMHLVVNLLRRDLALDPVYEIPEHELKPLFNKIKGFMTDLQKEQ